MGNKKKLSIEVVFPFLVNDGDFYPSIGAYHSYIMLTDPKLYMLTFCTCLQVVDEYDQNVHFVEIDIEEDPEIAEAAGIMGTPCVQFFKNKEMLRLVRHASLDN